MAMIHISTEKDTVQQFCMFSSKFYKPEKTACFEYIYFLIITSTVVLYCT
jgi:hypothetical protein